MPSARPFPWAKARAARRGPPAASGGGPNLRRQRKIGRGSRCVDGPGDCLEIADDPFGLPVPGGIGPYQHLEQIGERPAVRLYRVAPEPCRRKRGRGRTRCRLPCGAPRRRCGPAGANQPRRGAPGEFIRVFISRQLMRDEWYRHAEICSTGGGITPLSRGAPARDSCVSRQ